MAENEIRAIAAQAEAILDAPPAPGSDREFELKMAALPRNDTGNSARFLARAGRNFLQIGNVGLFAYDRRWDFGEGEPKSRAAAQRVAEAIRYEAAALESLGRHDGEDEKAFRERIDKHKAWSVQSGNSNRLTGMLNEAAPHLRRRQDELDAELFRFNCSNGTLELGAAGGEDVVEVRYRGFDRRDLLTRISPVEFDPAARGGGVWQRFLDQILPEKDVQTFLQAFFGYCLTGDVSEQALLLLQGEGSDGKSTLINAIAYVLGDHAMAIPINSLMADSRRGGSEATPDLARLPGARLVTSKEPKQGAVFDEGILKSLTGEREMTVRHLNRDFFEFAPAFKLVITCNRMPIVRGDDDGTWRRFLVVKFEHPIRKVNKHFFEEMLKPEASAILNWLIEGFKLWRVGGLPIPPSVRAATDKYRTESDPLGEWFASKIVVTGLGSDEIDNKTLRGNYEEFCRDNGYEPISSTAFGRRMASRRGVIKRKSGAVRWERIAFLSQVEAREQHQRDHAPNPRD